MGVPNTFAPKVTDVGKAAAIDASNNGLTLRLTHVGFGTGQYDPVGDETVMLNEVKRVPLTGAMRPKPNQMRVAGVWSEFLAESEIGEVGFFAGTTLFAIWSRDVGGPIGYKTQGVDFVMFCELVFEEVPADSVEVVINTDISEAMSALLVHEVAVDAHSQYLLRKNFVDAHALMTAVTVTTTGANTIALTLPPETEFLAYAPGQQVVFVANENNTGPVTVNVNARGVKPVRKSGSISLAAGDILDGSVYTLFYDGTAWQLSSGVGSGATMMRYPFVATAGQTNFSLPYVPGGLVMIKNGEVMLESTYTATDGQVVILGTGATAGDNIEALAFKAFAIADAYTKLDSDAKYTPRTLEAQLAPPGMVSWFARETAPAGWLKANGSTVSRTTHAALFAAIGTRFGAGDGSTTFRLPDLRGEFTRSWDDGRGIDTGRTLGSSQADDIKAHTHQAPTSNGITNPSGVEVPVAGTFTDYDYAFAAPTSSTGGAETRPRNISLLACIKT